MDFKALSSQIFNGSLTRRVSYRVTLLAAAISVVAVLHMLSGSDLGSFSSVATNDCVVNLGSVNVTFTPRSYLFQSRFMNPVWSSFDGSVRCQADVNLTVNVVNDLMGKQFLDGSTAKSLCVGEGSALAVTAMKHLGFSNVSGVQKPISFPLKRKEHVYELDYEDSSFDFVYCRDLDKVSVPALLILEVERVLRPGGIGALLVGVRGSNPSDLIRSATPVSSLLRTSNVVHVGYMNDLKLNLVVFKKRTQNETYFEQYSLPADCSSLEKTKPFIQQMEPLVETKPSEFEKRISYLPKFVDTSSMRRLVYVDIGAGVLLNSNVSNWFLPSYPIDQKAFNAFFVDYNTSILLSYVKQPGVTFVYHPGLAGKNVTAKVAIDGNLDPSLEDEEFDFLAWFKETVQYADFVVLKMNAGEVEMKFLSDLFETGAICFVDELFLHCSDDSDRKGVTRESCLVILKGLRSSGVFVHQWWVG